MVKRGKLLIALAAAAALPPSAVQAAPAPSSIKSSPPYLKSASRPVRASDFRASHLAAPANTTLVDPIVSNTNPNLKTTDTFPNGEPSIAVDPSNPNRIVLEAFSSCWLNVCGGGNNASLFTSTNGGTTWTKSFTVPPPPGAVTANPSGCPCDQTPDFGRTGTMFSTFLYENGGPPGAVYTGSTTDPTSAAAWAWHTTAGTADKTNSAVSTHDVDQPWLRVNRNPTTASQDDAYTAYDDFSTNPVTPRVAVAPGSAPPVFTIDHAVGSAASCCVNPGLRLAPDPTSGAMYALWEQDTPSGAGFTVNYLLNRSTDGGNTWTLNGNANGVAVVFGVQSDQFTNSQDRTQHLKFGTVNALLGGIDSAAVDPNTGDLYYAYGQRNGSGNNQILIKRLTPNGSGGLTIPASGTLVSGSATQTALPSVAVASDGTVGVLYDSFDGMSGGFPVFTAHLAQSSDHGATWSDASLMTFSSPAADNADDHQRVLGDYHQLKSVGLDFYGTTVGNGVAFGRTSTVHADPIFFHVDRTPPDTSITSGPAEGSTTGPSPSFGFSSTESGSSFECSLDGGAFAVCSSPDTLGPLTTGPHVFQVEAIDAGGNVDPSPQLRNFTVDANPPDTSITSGPADGSVTNNPSPSFGFSSTEANSIFQCSIDGGPMADCSSPTTLSHVSRASLVDGSHTFAVQAIDQVGNTDASPASRTFRIDTTAPVTTIVSGPSGKTRKTKAKFKFKSNEAGSTFQCRLDKKTFKPCTSPRVLKHLKRHKHIFRVEAIDTAGNVDTTPAKDKWKIRKKKRRHHHG